VSGFADESLNWNAECACACGTQAEGARCSRRASGTTAVADDGPANPGN